MMLKVCKLSYPAQCKFAAHVPVWKESSRVVNTLSLCSSTSRCKYSEKIELEEK